MARIILALMVIIWCNYTYAQCAEKHRIESANIVNTLDHVTMQMESYVNAAKQMYIEKKEPETILSALSQFMITLETEFNEWKDLYNNIDMQYDCGFNERKVRSIYLRITNSSIDYAHLKFKLERDGKL